MAIKTSQEIPAPQSNQSDRQVCKHPSKAITLVLPVLVTDLLQSSGYSSAATVPHDRSL